MRAGRVLFSVAAFALVGLLAWLPPPGGSAEEARAASVGAPPSLIVIDADNQSLTLYENGEQVARYAVAVGTNRTPSPLGVWQITQMRRGWGGGFGSRWMGLDCPWGTFGIHGTNRPGSIGGFASHGCIRMLNRDVEDLYGRVSPGTPVIIERAAYGDLAGPIRTLAPGDRGSDVYQLQLRLNAAGYQVGWADGIYGETTKRALLQYKKERGLQNDHSVDYATKRALGMVLFE